MSLIFLLGLVRGKVGEPIAYQKEYDTTLGGPFESSNNSSRYALTQAIADRFSFELTPKEAKFATPDVVYHNGKFFSIFTPGVSFLGVPLYIIGKYFGFPQFTTYLLNVILAFINMLLVAKLSRKFGAGNIASYIAGFIFLFGTNALSYATTYTQHHLTILVILLSLLNLFGKRTFLKNVVLGGLFGIGLLADIPNAFFFIPVLLYALYKSFDKKQIEEKVALSLKLNIVGLIFGILPFLALFGWYNHTLTGSYTLTGQLIGRSDVMEVNGKIIAKPRSGTKKLQIEKKLPFDTRNQLNGLYILLISDERGWLIYSPVIIIGFIGLYVSLKKKNVNGNTILAVAVILTVVTSYSMFGDPWGGWSFGPRYLLPATAIASAGIGVLIEKFKQNKTFVIVFAVISIYSITISLVGAITTNAVPPKVEAVNLSEPIPHTYQYNLKLLEKDFSSSIAYNLYFAKFISARYFVTSYLVVISSILFISLIATQKDQIRERENI